MKDSRAKLLQGRWSNGIRTSADIAASVYSAPGCPPLSDPGTGKTRSTARTGTAAASDGLIYQLDVSILISLDLLLASQVSRALTLEPANQEDLELDVEDEPGVLAEHIELDAYQLIVQCKLRNTGLWKP